MAVVRIPTPLRRLTNGVAEVVAEGEFIADVLDSLEASHPGLKERICDENGEVRRFVNIYVNNEDIRFLEGTKTKIGPQDQLSIIPAIAGGVG